jgi:uncharacterized membrane protein YczE
MRVPETVGPEMSCCDPAIHAVHAMHLMHAMPLLASAPNVNMTMNTAVNTAKSAVFQATTSIPAVITMPAVVSAAATKNVKYLVLALLAVLTALQWRDAPVSARELLRRVPQCVGGLFCFALGIALFFHSQLGTGPWDVLHGGLSKISGLPVGLIINIIGLIVLPLWIPLKVRIGLGTVLNALLIGVFLDMVKPRMHDASALWLQLTLAIVGVLIIGIGSGLYIGAGLGAGPRDGIMVGLSRLGLSVRAARTLVEAVTLLIGWLLGGKIGFGTIIFLVGIGPVVQVALPRLSLAPLPSPAPVAQSPSAQV